MTRIEKGSGRAWVLLGLVGINIVLQLLNASLIKYATTVTLSRPWLLLGLLVVVLGLAFGRFLAWGAMHKRYPVSVAYPATALFFPCVVLLAYAYGEKVTLTQGMGAALVTVGVLLLLGAFPRFGRRRS